MGPTIVSRALLVFGLAIAFCGLTRGAALASCIPVEDKIASAQVDLRAAEPARDATKADFDRRLGLVASAYQDLATAETTRTTTIGGCGDIQEVYEGMLTTAWADLVLAYLKPSLEFYVPDPSCKTVSHFHTLSVLLAADETMNRSLISWNPFKDSVVADRDHVTKLVAQTAGYLNISLPSNKDQDEDFARQYRYQLEAAKKAATVDCVSEITDSDVPKSIATGIFAP